ncbi:MAG TPA: VOC family protein [Alphaproteobacteria bacterium]|nr:VOC family protein [Alphaproteobacteria bacterium]
MRPYAPLDHVSIAVADLARAGRFYDAVLAPLGIGRVKETPGAVGYGTDRPFFWLLRRRAAGAVQPGIGLHFCFGAGTRAAVDAFHRIALAEGAADNGAPGLRTEYHPHYYGAFVIDADGYKIEAVCHQPE